MKATSALIVIALFSFGCQEQKLQEKKYVDVDSLVNAQVYHLSTSKSSLRKIITMGSKIDSAFNPLDSAAWSNELEVFRQLDLINRPIFKDAYTEKVGVKDTRSNLLIHSFEVVAKSPVPFLRLYYQDIPTRLRKLEAVYEEKNSLYSSQRKLEMLFDNSSGKSILTGYIIEGHQKMILSDSVHYTIQAKVVF